MHDTKRLLRDSRNFAHEHRLTSWWCLISTIVVLSACLTVAWLSSFHLAIRVAASVVGGLVLVRFFILYHDYQHGAILANSRIASLIMWAYGLIAINPPSIWNRSHNHHHKNNAKIYGADIGSYPVMTIESYEAATPRQRWIYRVTRHPLNIASAYLTIFLYGMCLRSLLAQPKQHLDSAFALLTHGTVAALTAYFGGWDAMLLVVVLPFIVASAIGAYFFYAQHNYPGVKLRKRADWDYSFAALESSSFIQMGPLMHWFTGNIGYHHVHHLNFKIPFYRLPEAMAHIPELQNPGTTSLRPRDIIACFRLKIWDPVHNRMIGFKELARHNAAQAAQVADTLAVPDAPGTP